MFDHRGKYRLHVFGDDGVAAGDQAQARAARSRPMAARGDNPAFSPDEWRVWATSAWT